MDVQASGNHWHGKVHQQLDTNVISLSPLPVHSTPLHQGLSIKCYTCDSTSNKECMDLKDNSAIVAEDCSPSKMASTTGNWLADLTRIDYFGGKEITVPMVCQKIVATNEIGETMTYRGCQLDGGKSDLCQIAYGKAKAQRGVDIESCSICKEDACNGGVRMVAGRLGSIGLAGVTLVLLGFAARQHFL
ncbi:AGAP008115-PA-like protein [Anopheles sinensis]|uniref:AGAP008115-PA-like protein n=1 Tax=Anopheles sinensis TaxID=74873 RepID=A0A084W8A5_ANOSI|nr:AGAP008115-PA-like protein [Anopheles sinensis]